MTNNVTDQQNSFSAPPRVHSLRMEDDIGGMDLFWIDAVSDRTIAGVASTPDLDKHSQAISSIGCVVRFPIPLLLEHGTPDGLPPYSSPTVPVERLSTAECMKRRVGEIVLVRRSVANIFVHAVIDETEAGNRAWALIQSGEVKKFCVAPLDGSCHEMGGARPNNCQFFDHWALQEVSIVRKTSNISDTTFFVLPRELAVPPLPPRLLGK